MKNKGVLWIFHTNLINFLEEIEYHDYEIFKSKYYKKFMDLKIYKGSGYYISQ